MPAALAAASLQGSLPAWQPLAKIEQEADAILFGAAGHGVQAANCISFAIDVARVVKGDAAIAGGVVSVCGLVVWDPEAGAPMPSKGTSSAARLPGARRDRSDRRLRRGVRLLLLGRVVRH